VITFGIILFVIGIIAGIAVLKTLGLFLLVIGVVLFLLGFTGHNVGGRRHYW
jgi:Family of unknown function (DUF6131)